MSRINIHNYEAFWLDYLEKNLSTDDVAEFLLFISQQPELNIELDEELSFVAPTFDASISAESKETFKEIAELEELIVLELDDEIKDNDRIAELKSKYPEEYQLFKEEYTSTLLVRPNLVFDEHSDLKKPLVIPMYLKATAAAAVIALIFTLIPWSSSEEVADLTDTQPSLNTTNTAPSKLMGIDVANHINHKKFKLNSGPEKPQTPSADQNSPNPDLMANKENSLPEQTQPLDNESPLESNTFDDQVAIDSTNIPVKNQLNDQVVSVIDSSSTTPPIVDLENKDLATEDLNKQLTIPEFLAEKVLKVERKDEEPLVASILDQKTNLNVDYQKKESEDKKVTQFKLGKFEFYKSAKK